MSILEVPDPKSVRFDPDRMFGELSDGRRLGIPPTWFPRLLHATSARREAVWLSPSGLHWDDIDDIPVADLIAGRGDMTNRPATTA